MKREESQVNGQDGPAGSMTFECYTEHYRSLTREQFFSELSLSITGFITKPVIFLRSVGKLKTYEKLSGPCVSRMQMGSFSVDTNRQNSYLSVTLKSPLVMSCLHNSSLNAQNINLIAILHLVSLGEIWLVIDRFIDITVYVLLTISTKAPYQRLARYAGSKSTLCVFLTSLAV